MDDELTQVETIGPCVVCRGPTNFMGVDINGFDVFVHRRCAPEAPELGVTPESKQERPAEPPPKRWRNGPYGELP